MRSGITELDENLFLVWVDLGRVDGKRPRHQVRVKGLRAAQRERARLQHEAEAGTLILTDRSKLSDLLDLWLAAAKETVAAKTYERYAEIVERHVKPGIGATQLDRLQKHPEIIRTLLIDRRDHGGAGEGPLSRRTVVHIYRVLHGALQWAHDDGQLSVNPAAVKSVRDLVKAYSRAAREEFQYTCLTLEQMLQLIEATRGTQLHLSVVLAVGGGMRRGEALGLHWRDVDLSTGTVTVQRSLTQTNAGVVEKTPKTKNSIRSIVLPTFAVTELRAAWNTRGSLTTADSYVCCRADGSAIDPDTLSGDFAAFIRRQELPKVRYHDLRHSHASCLAAKGQPAKTISMRLGHCSAAFTLDTYVHAFEGADKAAAAALDADCASILGQQAVNEGVQTACRGHLRVVK